MAKIIAYSIVSAILCAIYVTIMLLDSYFKTTLLALYGAMIFVGVAVIFGAFVYVVDEDGSPQIWLLLLIIGAGVAIIFGGVKIVTEFFDLNRQTITGGMSDAAQEAEEVLSQPNMALTAFAFTPALGGCAGILDIALIANEDDEVPIVLPIFMFVFAFILNIIIAAIFSLKAAVIICGLFTAIFVLADLALVGRWAIQTMFGV